MQSIINFGAFIIKIVRFFGKMLYALGHILVTGVTNLIAIVGNLPASLAVVMISLIIVCLIYKVISLGSAGE